MSIQKNKKIKKKTPAVLPARAFLEELPVSTSQDC
jgi:hypothetical protein